MGSEAPPHSVSLPASPASRACRLERPYPLADVAGRESVRIHSDESDRKHPFLPEDAGVSRGAQPDLPSLHQRLDGYYRKGFAGQWQPYAVNGTFSILAGIISLILPVFLNNSVFGYAGGILVARGALILVSTLSAPLPGGFAVSLLSGFLYSLAGICLVLNILVEPMSLVLFFSIYFVSTGIVTILFALFYWRQHSGYWEWLVVSGVLNLDLALVSLSRLPEHFTWVLTIFLGLDLIAYGSAVLAVALASNDDAERRAGA